MVFGETLQIRRRQGSESGGVHVVTQVPKFDPTGQLHFAYAFYVGLVALSGSFGQTINSRDNRFRQTDPAKLIQRNAAVFDDIVKNGRQLRIHVLELQHQPQGMEDVRLAGLVQLT